MNTTIYRYPLDGTGVSPDNLVVNEEHQLSNRTIRCVAPTYGGFFADSVIVVDALTNIPLIHGRGADYVFGELFEFPTGRYEKEVFGLIVIKKPGVSKVRITYQALGGDYSYSMDAIIAMIDNLDIGDRPVAWPDIIGRPALYDPASHFHDIGDIYGFEYVVHAIERLRQAVLIGDVASHDEIYRYIDKVQQEMAIAISAVLTELQIHTSDKTNPHQVTKAQVGLSEVINYPVATQQQMDSGSTNAYVTPNTVRTYIQSAAVLPLTEHIADKTNPHQTTKAQVGLGSVENYPPANDAVAGAGVSDVHYMTPRLVRAELIRLAVTPIQDHISDKVNPHQTTKAQVGLGSVENYPPADDAIAQAGTSNTNYMTPRLVHDEINRLAVALISVHANDHSNPHQVSKAQIGLGSVENYPIATQDQMNAGSGGVYATPNTITAYITNSVGIPMYAHFNRFDNPHGVTKTQVGLGAVSNYPMATLAEMDAGTLYAAYVSPALVARYVANNNTTFNNHIADLGNPHQTNKWQVGLGSVENFPIATQLQMDSAVSNAYLTPNTVWQFVTSYAIQPLTNHVNQVDNPHQVTKAQVGLGSVQNYPIATQTDMDSASSTAYLTPNTVWTFVVANAVQPLSNHINRMDNPHNTTKWQVGLGNVLDYPVATQAQMDGAATNAYLTPNTVWTFVNNNALQPLAAHIARMDNPHNTTAAQVGLGSVLNYGIATQAQMNAGAGGVYATPNTVYAFVDAVMQPSYAHFSNYNNPHNTTKAQVGLGSVENYPIASGTIAAAGTSNTHYITPATMAYTLQQTVFPRIDTHLGDFNNPHRTTAAQVGLGSVLNYGVASVAQAQAGWDNAVYMTPYTSRVWMDAAFPLYFSGYHATLEEARAAGRDDKYMTPWLTGIVIGDRLANYYTRADVDWLIAQSAANNQPVFTSGTSAVYAWVNSYGSTVFRDDVNFFDVFPPSGKSMGNLQSFIASAAYIYFTGTVDSNDTIRCIWSALSDRVRIWVGSTEQRTGASANWSAVWK